MLIIEGSDCTGKTTLANKILARCKELGHEGISIRHLGRPNEDTFDFYTDYFSMIEPSVIQDRFHLGAFAYHNNKMTEEHLRIVEGWIYSRGGFIIVLYAGDFRAYRKRIEDDHHHSILRNDILEEANKRFYGLAHCQKHAIIDFSYDIFPLAGDMVRYVSEDIVNSITDKWLKRRKEYLYGLELLQQDSR